MRRLIIILILLFSCKCFALQKNVASQKWVVFAFDITDNTAKTGDAAQITANVYIDGVVNAVDDTNPTELEDGYYVFDLAQAETNGDYILICPASSTGSIQVIGCPMAVWTTPPYFPSMSIDSNGRLDIIKVAGTTQTANDMSGDVDAILTDTSAYDTDAEYAAAILNATTASYGGAGTYGQAIEDILVDTGEIGAAGAGLTAVPWNAAWDAEVESEVDDSIGGGTGTALTAIPWNAAWDAEVESEVDDSIGAGTGTALTAIPWNAAWDAEVESEVEDAVGADVTAILADTGTDGVLLSASATSAQMVTDIWAKAMSDLAAGAPSATASVLTAINWLYEAWRNKTITDGTDSEIRIFKDDGTTALVESDISDDGTDFTRGEMGAPD